MRLSYSEYLNSIHGGWLGKSIGGAIGMRFEANKSWIELGSDEMFPAAMPPNDDLDMQVLWLKVLEEKGLQVHSNDLAEAWLHHCWYPFNEYGIFRRNWRLGIGPPTSGRFTNQHWETGMGCPIRAEIWGYIFPGAPEIAADYAAMDGALDHGEQSIGAEKMFASMASLAFVDDDIRRLIMHSIVHLPQGSAILRLTERAIDAYDMGLSLREARTRIMIDGVPEACDARINVPFTVLALLYGNGDLEQTILSAVRCGYDTDCTAATSAALVGQILGSSSIPGKLRDPIGDTLVMGIDYRRSEATLSALARDTARIGCLFSSEARTGTTVVDAPPIRPFGSLNLPPVVEVEYDGVPCLAPGEQIGIRIEIRRGIVGSGRVSVHGPRGWRVIPESLDPEAQSHDLRFTIHAPGSGDRWPLANRFSVYQETPDGTRTRLGEFGVAGAALWRFLGAYYDALPRPDDSQEVIRRKSHHFADIRRPLAPDEPNLDFDALYSVWSDRIGRPAVLPSYEHEVAPERMVGLEGPYCAYLDRTIYSPKRRDCYFLVGNTDSFSLDLNGERIAAQDEATHWAPFNNKIPAVLEAGPNHLLLKMIRRNGASKLTIGIRERRDNHGAGSGQNKQDWVIETADAVPFGRNGTPKDAPCLDTPRDRG